LSQIPYKDLPEEEVKLGKRNTKGAYDDSATMTGRHYIPEPY
jgi:hypothetical protein